MIFQVEFFTNESPKTNKKVINLIHLEYIEWLFLFIRRLMLFPGMCKMVVLFFFTKGWRSCCNYIRALVTKGGVPGSRKNKGCKHTNTKLLQGLEQK
jgi:hypothetical protein